MKKVEVYAGRVRALADWLDGKRSDGSLANALADDMGEYVLPLVLVEDGGIDPYPQEWLACRGEAVLACSPNVVEELDRQHAAFIASLARWRDRPDGSAARSFAEWLEKLAATGGKGGSPVVEVKLTGRQAAQLDAAAARNAKRLAGSQIGGKVSAENREAKETAAAGVSAEIVLAQAFQMVEAGELVKNAVAFIAKRLGKKEDTARKRFDRWREKAGLLVAKGGKRRKARR